MFYNPETAKRRFQWAYAEVQEAKRIAALHSDPIRRLAAKKYSERAERLALRILRSRLD